MSKTVEEAIASLRNPLRQRRCVLFVGAGISVPSGLPTAAQLAERLDLGGRGLQLGSQAVRRDPVFYQNLREIFRGKRPNDLHRSLALLRARYYVTTNFDDLLEAAFRDLYPPAYFSDKVGVVFRKEHLADEWQRDHTVVKMHGDIGDRESLIVAPTDHSRALEKPSVIYKFAQATLATHPVLFLGYSVTDIDLMHFLVEETEWSRGAPPPRYALVPAIQGQDHHQDRELLKSLGVRPVWLECDHEGSIARETERFLTHLCEEVEEHSFFTRLDEGPLSRTPTALLERAWVHYRSGRYEQAQEALAALEQRVDNWRQHVSLFGRYAYLSVKLLDKLEQWDRLFEKHRAFLESEFRLLERALPKRVWVATTCRYEAAVALPLFRSGRPADALASLKRALSLPPVESGDHDLQALFADWHTLRAMARLGLWAFGEVPGVSEIEEAEKDLEIAAELFTRYGGMGSSEETHYLGRFYGTRAFLRLARLETERPDSESLGGHPEVAAALADARLGNDHPSRIDYGRLAGRYCEAYCHYFLGASLPAGEEVGRELDESLDFLKQAEAAMPKLAPMAKAKIAALRLQALRLRRAKRGGGISTAEAKVAYEAALSEFAGRGGSWLAERIRQGQLDCWLKTPLN